MRPITGIDLERALLDPERIARARTKRSQPTPLNDQIDAATEHAAWVQDQVSKLLSNPRTTDRSFQDCPEWIRLGISEEIAAWWVGRARTCMHSPTPNRPQPVFAAAWKPGRVVCERCCFLLQWPKGSAKDRTCDHCGYVVSGVKPDI